MAHVTKSGFYSGKFLKAGQSLPDEEELSPALDKMTKEELLVEVERRGLEVKPGANKAEILAILNS